MTIRPLVREPFQRTSSEPDPGASHDPQLVSDRVMEKLRMKPDGVQRQRVVAQGEFEDIAMYTILNSQNSVEP